MRSVDGRGGAAAALATTAHACGGWCVAVLRCWPHPCRAHGAEFNTRMVQWLPVVDAEFGSKFRSLKSLATQLHIQPRRLPKGSFCGMLSRCLNPTTNSWVAVGGRGGILGPCRGYTLRWG